MKVVNKSRKIISINGEPLLPGADLELAKGMETHPSIADYLAKNILVDVAKVQSGSTSNGISDLEKAQIEEAAIARYKAEQEQLAKAEAEKAAEIKAVKAMKKEELLNKAAGMGIEVNDDDTADVVREKILTALAQ